MSQTINRAELTARIIARTGEDAGVVEKIVEATEEVIMSKYTNKFCIIFVFLVIILSFALAGCSLTPSQASVDEQAGSAPETLEPNPNLSPEEVVKIQVIALQNNDDKDTGIEITFRFASPDNKKVTGPLARFRRMVKNPAYSPMINHKLAEYDPIKISGDTAIQRVTIIEPDGNANVYQFTLSKQSGPPCDGCWMTDSVILVPTRRQQLDGA